MSFLHLWRMEYTNLGVKDLEGNEIWSGVSEEIEPMFLIDTPYGSGQLILEVSSSDDTSEYSLFVMSQGSIISENNSPDGAASAALLDGFDSAYVVTASDLLQGFSDTDGDVLSLSGLVSSSGNVADNRDGTYTVNPDPNFNGSVALSYDVVDGNGGSLAATPDLLLGSGQ